MSTYPEMRGAEWAYQQSAGDGLLAKVQEILLQCHGLIVDADNEVAQLRYCSRLVSQKMLLYALGVCSVRKNSMSS